MALADLANPTRFLALANRALPWLVGATVIAFAFGFAQVLASPDERWQGDTVKIMYLHVPSAWLGMLAWGLMAVAGLGSLVWRHPLADVAAKSAAPIGAAFTLLCLVTGSLWGQPTWGHFWVWDGRLTSVLVLFLMYLGLIMLWQSIDEPWRAGRVAAIFALVGTLILPVIKFSVECWNTLHQPASFLRTSTETNALACKLLGVSQPPVLAVPPIRDGAAMNASFVMPLIVMTVAFTLLFVTLHVAAMRNEILRRRVRTLLLMQANAAN
jgi:heme exporter protein C